MRYGWRQQLHGSHVEGNIAQATQTKESYVREAQDKETRLFALLDGLTALWNDTTLLDLLRSEGLGDRPELAGTYEGVASNAVNQLGGW